MGSGTTYHVEGNEIVSVSRGIVTSRRPLSSTSGRETFERAQREGKLSNTTVKYQLDAQRAPRDSTGKIVYGRTASGEVIDEARMDARRSKYYGPVKFQEIQKSALEMETKSWMTTKSAPVQMKDTNETVTNKKKTRGHCSKW
jgi:hypothetical protein